MTTKVYKNIGNVVCDDDHAVKACDMIDDVAGGGKFFTVGFVKKDGTKRVMNGRLGVTKHLAGGVKTLTPNYICVYDTVSKGYRSINPCTVYEVNGVAVN